MAKHKENAKSLEDFGTIIVAMVDKKGSFTDPIQNIMFTESTAVQKVQNTPFIQKAIVGGTLKAATEKELEEHQDWYKAYVTKHSAKANETAKFLSENAETPNQKLKAEQAKAASALAEAKLMQDRAEAAEAKLKPFEEAEAKAKADAEARLKDGKPK